MNDYFALFGLSPRFNIDLNVLEKHFKKMQAEVHPDRFVTASDTEKLKSMHLATLANTAYQTLKHPAQRAKYLLELRGHASIHDNNTAMPMDFLAQQMDWREQLEEAKQAQDLLALESLLHSIQTMTKTLHAELVDLLDHKKDDVGAMELTRKLMFIDKVCADITHAIIQLED